MVSKLEKIESQYGPQSHSDYPFQRKARLLQSWYRYTVLKEPCGCGPYKTSKTQYGNMLICGDVTGKNFLNQGVFKYAKKKVALKKDIPQLTIDEYRLFNNMLSSMPMCFNLFYPLRQALKNKEPFVHDVIKAIFLSIPISKVTCIDIEYIPQPISECIDDKSAFDAVIWFEDSNGSKGIIGIEVKYTDKLGMNMASKNDKKIQVAKQSGIFTQQAINGIQSNGCAQIMRNVLLAESYRLKHDLLYSLNIILSPKEEPYSDKEVEDFQQLLLPSHQNIIRRVTLEEFVLAAQRASGSDLANHFQAFSDRYLDFDKIEPLL